ncbi:hypothetical protein [Streptomyces niveus]
MTTTPESRPTGLVITGRTSARSRDRRPAGDRRGAVVRGLVRRWTMMER